MIRNKSKTVRLLLIIFSVRRLLRAFLLEFDSSKTFRRSPVLLYINKEKEDLKAFFCRRSGRRRFKSRKQFSFKVAVGCFNSKNSFLKSVVCNPGEDHVSLCRLKGSNLRSRWVRALCGKTETPINRFCVGSMFLITDLWSVSYWTSGATLMDV